jgi:hypothetical protein
MRVDTAKWCWGTRVTLLAGWAGGLQVRQHPVTTIMSYSVFDCDSLFTRADNRGCDKGPAPSGKAKT